MQGDDRAAEEPEANVAEADSASPATSCARPGCAVTARASAVSTSAM